MKTEFVIEFESAAEMKEFIAKINPVIKIAYSESQEIEDFRQKLLSLQSENNELRATPVPYGYKLIKTTEDLPASQTVTFTPQEKYENKAGKLKPIFKEKNCITPFCHKLFTPHYNTVKFCPECQAKRKANPSKKVKNPQSKSD